MLKVKSVDVEGNECVCAFEVDAKESVTFAGRVVKMDFGSITTLESKEVTVIKGESKVVLTMMNFDNLPPGEYAVYLDTVSASPNALLIDDGPHFFTKGDE